MGRLLFVAHCPSTNTRALRDAFVAGAREGGGTHVEIRVLAPPAAEAADVKWADLVAVGTTENFGSMAGLTKDFFERIYYPCLEETEGKPCALYVRAGNDGAGTLQAVERIVTGLRWRYVQSPLLLRGDFAPDFADRCRELGAGLAAGVDAGIF